MTFYNRNPHRLEAPVITQLPPNGDTNFPPNAVDLYLRVGAFNNVQDDPLVGNVEGNHTVVPEPSSLVLLCLGLFGLRLKRCRLN